MPRLLVTCLALTAVGGVLTGCQDGRVNVKGNVSVSGQPLEKGYIEFHPQGGGGTPIGVPIVGGKYSAQMPTGDRTVLITEEVATEIITSTEELQRLAAEGKSPAPPPLSRVKPETKGNNRQVTISQETKSLDFNLEP